MKPIEYLRNSLNKSDEPVSMQSEQMTKQANAAAENRQKAIAQHKQNILQGLNSPQTGA